MKKIKTKGEDKMLDIIFIASIILGFVLLKFFTDWCEKVISQ